MGTFPGEDILIEGEMVLGSICYSNGTQIDTLNSDFYQDVDGHINELEKYDVVYLLKADFMK